MKTLMQGLSLLLLEILRGVNIPACWSLTLLWHTPKTLKSKRANSVSGPEDSSPTISIHHTLHHALQQVFHRVSACPTPTSIVLCKSMSEKLVQTLALEHLPK